MNVNSGSTVGSPPSSLVWMGTHRVVVPTPREGCWEGPVTEVGEAWRTESVDAHAARLCLSYPLLPGTIRSPSHRSMWLLAGSLSLTRVLES